MMPEERRKKIVELLYSNSSKSITVKALCDTLNASEATIRRDLTVLEEDGKLERTHGGAILNSNILLDREESFGEKEVVNTTEKRMIAKEAFKHIKYNDSIFLDGGTTTIELAKLIGQSHLKLHIFTNAPHFSKYLAQNPKVEQYIIGGKIRNNTLSAIGQMAIEMIKRFRIHKVFLGVNAISIEYGLTTPDFEESEIKRAMLESARERIVLADKSKFNKVALCEIAPITAVDTIITEQIENQTILQYKNQGVKIIDASRERI